MKNFLVASLIACAVSANASTPSPYAGQESNPIKSLSPGEIDDLMQGNGMGFAKAAELNQYPGPRHVLDLSDRLQLSDRQIGQSHRILDEMRANAIRLGIQLVEYEKQLDDLFSTQRVSESYLEPLLLRIGETRARLRGVHLLAHLRMKEILTPHQVMRYDSIRGYSNAQHDHRHAH